MQRGEREVNCRGEGERGRERKKKKEEENWIPLGRWILCNPQSLQNQPCPPKLPRPLPENGVPQRRQN